MKTSGLVVSILGGVLLVAEPAFAGTDVPGAYTGAWRIAGAIDEEAREIPPTPYVGETLVFENNNVAGPAPLGCGDAYYEALVLPPEGLFQGAFPEDVAPAAAARLGFSSEIPTLRVDCDTGSFDYHADGDRLMIMFDNVIYRLERKN